MYVNRMAGAVVRLLKIKKWPKDDLSETTSESVCVHSVGESTRTDLK